MRELSHQEIAAVFGGDNPAMGPYTPPLTAEWQNNYMMAQKELIAYFGPFSGKIESWMTRDLAERSAQWNLANGYNREGTQYLFPSGVWQPTPTVTPEITWTIHLAEAWQNEVVQVNGVSNSYVDAYFDTLAQRTMDMFSVAGGGGSDGSPAGGGPNYNGPSGFFPSQ